MLEGRRQIRIRGAGPQASRLAIRGKLSLDAEELALERLGIRLAEDAQTIDLRGREIHAAGCAFDQELGLDRQSWLVRYDPGYQGDAVATDAFGNFVFGGRRHTGVGGRVSNPANQEAFVLKMGLSGEVVWIYPVGHNVRAVGLDSAGNVLVLGGCNDGDDLGDGEPVSSDGDYVLKLDPEGAYLWSRAFGTGGSSVQNGGVGTDEADNVLIAGAFKGTADCAGAKRTASAGPLSSRTDVYVVKLDPDGGLLWVQTFGTESSNDGAKAVASDGLGNVCICGEIQDPLDFGGPTLPPSSDKFVVKLSRDGAHLWSRGFDGGGDADAVDGEGNLMVGGVITTEMEVDGRRIGEVNQRHPYILQLTADGQDRWGVALESSVASGTCGAVGVDSVGRVWGASGSSSTFAFLVALSNQGEHREFYTFPGLSSVHGLTVAPSGPVTDNLLMTGRMEGPVTIGGRTLDYPHLFSSVAFFMKLAGLETGTPVVRVSSVGEVSNLDWSGNRMRSRHQELQEIPDAEGLAGISFAVGSPLLLELAGQHHCAWIADNHIDGVIVLTDGEIEETETPDDAPAPSHAASPATLHFEANRLHQLVCMFDPEDPTTALPDDLILRHNGFENTGSRFVAVRLALAGNCFRGGDADAPIVATASSVTAVYTGNQARNPGARLRRQHDSTSSDDANLLAFEDS